VPVILNTSFNRQEPIVQRPEVSRRQEDYVTGDKVSDQDELSGLKLLLRQVESPLVLILIFGAGI
jgi:hypothetical protein